VQSDADGNVRADLTVTNAWTVGKVSYIETATTDKIDYSDGVSCVAHMPYVFEHLEGTFTSQNSTSGTLSTDSITMDCNHGIGSLQFNAGKGSWTAQL